MTRWARFVVVLVLNLVLVAGLVIVGISAHSLGVLAEGADYLADAAAIGVSLLAIWLSVRPSADGQRHRHPKATTVAALVNSSWLLALSVLVVAGAIDRLTATTPQIHGLPVIVVSGIAAVVMLGGALLLGGDIDDHHDDDHDHDGDDLNMRAVLLDTAAAAGVALTGAIILAAHGLYWLDPAVALVIAVVVGYHALRLLTRSSRPSRQPRSAPQDRARSTVSHPINDSPRLDSRPFLSRPLAPFFDHHKPGPIGRRVTVTAQCST